MHLPECFKSAIVPLLCRDEKWGKTRFCRKNGSRSNQIKQAGYAPQVVGTRVPGTSNYDHLVVTKRFV